MRVPSSTLSAPFAQIALSAHHVLSDTLEAHVQYVLLDTQELTAHHAQLDTTPTQDFVLVVQSSARIATSAPTESTAQSVPLASLDLLAHLVILATLIPTALYVFLDTSSMLTSAPLAQL